MFKKLLIASAVFAISSGVAFADGGYAGYSGGMRDNIKNTNSYRGLEGRLFLGYGTIVNPAFYFGGEIFGAPGSMSINNNGLKTTYEYGVSLVPSMVISEHAMMFLRLGIVRTHFNSANKTISGGQLGVGVQTGLTQSWDLRAEYIYTAFNTVNSATGAPKADQAYLGLVYKFE